MAVIGVADNGASSERHARIRRLASHRRHWTRGLRLVLAAGTAGFLITLWHGIAIAFTLLAYPDAEGSASAILWAVIFKLPVGPYLSEAAKQTVLEAWLLQRPNLLFGGIGAAIGGLAGVRARALYDRFLVPFDDDLFAPIPVAKAYDPLRGTPGDDQATLTVPWCEPRGGPRGDLWRRLHGLAEIADDGASSQAFGWTVIMGRSGSGKSRMAMEFARGFSDLSRGRSKPPTRRQRFATWFRVQVRRRSCGPCDPWDAGWIHPGEGMQDTDLQSAQAGWIGGLETWQPRRPTIVLLDDPVIGDARAIVAAFGKQASRYRHPVRLLVVNQSAPKDLDLNFDRERDTWVSRFVQPIVQPLIVGADAVLTAPDIRRMRKVLKPRHYMEIGPDPAVERMLVITRGNPLLVELAFDRLARGHALNTLDEESLPAERVDRIIESIRAAGYDDDDRVLDLLAAATLAGSGDRRADRAELESAIGVNLGLRQKLHRIFPAEDADLRMVVPPVRPELIGDAFVRRIAEEIGEASDDPTRRGGHRLSTLVAAGWHAEPRAMLRSVLRLGGRQNVLGRALAHKPPVDLGLSLAELTAVYAEASLQIQREDWLAGQCDRGRGLVPVVRELMERIPAQDLAEFADALIALLRPNPTIVVRYREANDLIVHALTLASEIGAWRSDMALASRLITWRGASRMSQADWNPDVSRLLIAIKSKAVVHGRIVAEYLIDNLVEKRADPSVDRVILRCAASFARFDVTSNTTNQDMQKIVAELCGIPTGDGATFAATAFEHLPTPEAVEDGRRQAWLACSVCRESADAGNTSECRDVIEWVQRIADAHPGDRGIDLALACAWRELVAALQKNGDIRGCRDAVGEIQRIATSYSKDREIDLVLAQAWCDLAYAFAERGDFDGCYDVIEQLRRVAEFRLGDRDIDFELALAWRHLASISIRGDEPGGYRDGVDQVGRIADAHLGDRDIDLELARSWRDLARGLMFAGDTSGCREAVQHVQRIADAHPGDGLIDLGLAITLRYLAYSLSRSGDAQNCRHAVERVWRIANLYAGNPGFLRVLVQTLSYYADALAQVGDSHECRKAFNAARDIASSLSRDVEISRSLAEAAACLADVLSRELDRGSCHNIVQYVGSIAADHPKHLEIDRALARSWRHYGYVCFVEGDVTHCRKAVLEILRITADHVHDSQCMQILVEAKIFLERLLRNATEHDSIS